MLGLLCLFLLTAISTRVIASPPPCIGFQPVCAFVNEINNPLEIGGPTSPGALFDCQYSNSDGLSSGPVCSYNTPNVAAACVNRFDLINGADNCPLNLGQALPGSCAFVNQKNAPFLPPTGLSDDNGLICNYVNEPTACQYSPTGDLSSGPASCPPSIGSAVLPPPVPQSCPASNSADTLTSETSSGGFITCNYSNGDTCTYSLTGEFVNGPGDCPKAIKTGALASTLSVDAAVANSNPDSTNTGASNEGTLISKPILIALLGMNASLVLAVLAISFALLLSRHNSSALNRGRDSRYTRVASKLQPPAHLEDNQSYDPHA
ncbi:hypothetical protein C8F04DRAFT_1155300 [Mycena alexandri]|uniref:Uncharacterized protein n=1 Tax=Mycena alexandri TaxID=1745969 RepID=A0AAD6S0E0_9AGAR|nr:hypothetical protein C8F04DRAFT_1155300 [Mycena alexandri]